MDKSVGGKFPEILNSPYPGIQPNYKSYPFVFDLALTDFLAVFIDDDLVVEDLNIYLFVYLFLLINNMHGKWGVSNMTLSVQEYLNDFWKR